ncbi:MAG: hypothetical protein WAQ27_00695 [Candidatus Microsaccharimonas sp.]
MLCRLGSIVLETTELSTVIPENDQFLITMKNGQQLSATDAQVQAMYRLMEDAAPLTAAAFENALFDHASTIARATRHAGDRVTEGLGQVAVRVGYLTPR